MATYAYDDFRIEFGPGKDGRYPVRARTPVGTDVVSEFVVPVGQRDIELAILGVIRGRGVTRRATWGPADTPAELADGTAAGALAAAAGPAPAAGATSALDAAGGQDVVAVADPPAIAPEPDPEPDPLPTNLSHDVQRFGERLAAALFAGSIGTAYDAASAALRPSSGLRLTLAMGQTPELIGLPWELLYRRPVFLASQRRSPLVRELTAGRRVAAPAIDDVVRILGVVASPSDLDPLRVEIERQRIVEAVQPMIDQRRVELEWLDPATPRGLQQALRDGSYHVVHFVGHSDITDDGEGVVFLEDPTDGAAVPINGTMLANLLNDQNSLRLVVLNSCKGAQTSLQDAYGGVATTLVGLGVPAVVAMQFEISDDAAVIFAEEFYTNLIGHQVAVDAAMAEARKAVLVGIGNGEWATPVLFVQDPNVALFDFRREAGADEERPSRPSIQFFRRVVPRRRAPALIGAGLLAIVLAVVAALLVWPDDPAPGPARFPELRAGSEGLVVQAAQLMLRDEGAVELIATGEFDEPTEAALVEFDGAHDLPPDGILGPLTWSNLVPTLRRGSSGDAVLAAQLLLNSGGSSLVTDGHFDAPTEGATRLYERAHGFPEDGIVDIDVWKQLIHEVPEDTPASATVRELTVTPVRDDQPRPRAATLAAVVADGDGVTVRTFRPDDGAVTVHSLGGVLDGHPVWSAETNRLAFDRAYPDSNRTRVYYVVPGVTADDGGKGPAMLITRRVGNERLPAWSVDGDLLYVASGDCAPGPDCPDNVRRATFRASHEAPLDRTSGYLGPISLDTLTIVGDVQAAGAFTNVTAIAADPTRNDSFAVIDDQGLWLVEPGGPRLIVPGGTAPLAFTSDGLRLMVAQPGPGGPGVAVYGRNGGVLASAVLSDLPVGSGDGAAPVAVPAGGAVLSLSLATAPGTSGVRALVDEVGSALGGVMVDLTVTSDNQIVVVATWPLPDALGEEPALAVAA